MSLKTLGASNINIYAAIHYKSKDKRSQTKKILKRLVV